MCRQFARVRFFCLSLSLSLSWVSLVFHSTMLSALLLSTQIREGRHS